MKKQMNAELMLVIVAIIWGTGFIGIDYAAKAHMSAMLILAARFIIASMVLLIVTYKELKQISKSEWLKGSIAGVFLFTGFYLQTIGQALTTVSNCAFLTTTNVIMVPFVVWLITKRKPALRTVLLALMTFVGISVLTINPDAGFSINIGDVYVLFGAVAFACHISYLELAVSDNSPKRITFIQISVAAILSTIGVFLFERDGFDEINYALGIPTAVYLGLFSTCLCFFMQTSAQKRTTAPKAGIIMSMEGFFGTLFSIVLGLELLTPKIIVGGVIILSAVILTEAKMGKKSNQIATTAT